MNLYNPQAECPKCGCKDINAIFRHKDEHFYDTSEAYNYSHHAEKDLIERVCKNCNFTWHETPLDSKKVQIESKSGQEKGKS